MDVFVQDGKPVCDGLSRLANLYVHGREYVCM